MRLVIQRVRQATVRVAEQTIAQIGPGLLILVGIGRQDDVAQAELLADKCVNLRIFADEAGKLNRSLLGSGGEILAVSQFTLYGNYRRGRRPNFTGAAAAELARPLFEHFVRALRAAGAPVQTGAFGQTMQVSLLNDGPVTLLLDSAELQRRKGQATIS
ncbi:MAG TPA: D-tyrosyl-tRNA(Tyr) deacylase [Candidatus Fraserbacteria bacterium]|nr:D-tyrosyl-tRNA(Tyr) deacylase [Candidatus Fraserbacteria bacterium]